MVSRESEVLIFRHFSTRRGRPAHVLDTSAGINAIEAAFYLYQSLKELEELWNKEKEETKNYKDFKHPINFNIVS